MNQKTLFSIIFSISFILTVFLDISKAEAQTKKKISKKIPDANILFGERNLTGISTNISDKISLYFDKEGYIYPAYFISNESLIKADASLVKWYQNNQKAFFEIAQNHNCKFSKYSLENCNILNDSISSLYIKQINMTTYKNANNNFKSLTFLIHGFRKPFTEINGDASSPTDYKKMQETINQYSKNKTFFVEIYWDALYSKKSFTNQKKKKFLFSLFEKSQINAEFVGEHLKKMLTSINHENINIITHSLGAKIAVFALLNANNQNTKTPSNSKINLMFIAPAISGELIVDNFYKRNTKIAYKNADNYHLSIIYNENDIALRKKIGFIGPGPYKHGNTTLGCNYDNAATKLKATFKTKYPNSTLDLYDFSEVGGCHLVRCYFSSKEMQEFVRKM